MKGRRCICEGGGDVYVKGRRCICEGVDTRAQTSPGVKGRGSNPLTGSE